MACDSVKLFGYWASPFSMRVHLALKLKGVEYEYVEEDLANKSPLLLKYNPVHKQIPVLVHNEKPLAESLVILEYIDEVWKQNPLMPEDQHGRALARFWAKFVDNKCVPAMMNAFFKKGEEKEKAVKEARENLKILESGLREKLFFGGETLGFMDIAAGWLGVWGRMTEEVADVSLIDAETMPLLNTWFERVLDLPIFKQCLPPRDNLLAHIKKLHEFRTGGST